MNYLIGDIGNTNIKICKINKNFRIVKTFIFNTKNRNLEKNIKKKLNRILKINMSKVILFSSVVPSIYKRIYKIFVKKKFKVFEVKKFRLEKIIKLRIKKLSQLGSDRICNAIGAYYKYKTNCIVIDFGTATTFDVVKKPAVYDGGVIAPGINLSIENLFSSTALLPMFKIKNYPHTYGKNTKEALNSGFFWGYQGLINNIVKKITKKNGQSFKIILTGGYSNLFKNKIDKKAKVEHDITIQGIIKIYKKFLI